MSAFAQSSIMDTELSSSSDSSISSNDEKKVQSALPSNASFSSGVTIKDLVRDKVIRVENGQLVWNKERFKSIQESSDNKYFSAGRGGTNPFNVGYWSESGWVVDTLAGVDAKDIIKEINASAPVTSSGKAPKLEAEEVKNSSRCQSVAYVDSNGDFNFRNRDKPSGGTFKVYDDDGYLSISSLKASLDKYDKEVILSDEEKEVFSKGAQRAKSYYLENFSYLGLTKDNTLTEFQMKLMFDDKNSNKMNDGNYFRELASIEKIINKKSLTVEDQNKIKKLMSNRDGKHYYSTETCGVPENHNLCNDKRPENSLIARCGTNRIDEKDKAYYDLQDSVCSKKNACDLSLAFSESDFKSNTKSSSTNGSGVRGNR